MIHFSLMNLDVKIIERVLDVLVETLQSAGLYKILTKNDGNITTFIPSQI